MVIVKKIQRTIYRNTIQLDPLFGKGPLHFVFFKVLLHFSRKHGEKGVTQVRGTEEQHCVTKEVIISRIRFKRRFNASLKTIFFEVNTFALVLENCDKSPKKNTSTFPDEKCTKNTTTKKTRTFFSIDATYRR